MPISIPKSIEILNDIYHSPDHNLAFDQFDALKLGLEALNFLSQWERDHNGDKLVILSGETE